MSREELADQAGVGVSTVYRIEQGYTMPRPYVVWRLSEALGVRPDRILEFQEVVGRARLGGKLGEQPLAERLVPLARKVLGVIILAGCAG
jgi:transcriptional regulator with XRE-family HTH domain